MPSSSWRTALRCYPVDSVPQLECGDKVLLPPDALKQITRLQLQWPLLFALCPTRRRARDGRSSSKAICAGVLEFTAEEDTMRMPRWMMEQLAVEAGDWVRVATLDSATVPKGAWCKLRPHTTAFSTAAAEGGARPMLEAAMRNYSALTADTTIVVQLRGVSYALDVLEVKGDDAAQQPPPQQNMQQQQQQQDSEGEGGADAQIVKEWRTVSLLGNTDLQVDFAPALDDPGHVCGTVAEAGAAVSATAAPAMATAPAAPAAPAPAASEAHSRGPSATSAADAAAAALAAVPQPAPVAKAAEAGCKKPRARRASKSAALMRNYSAFAGAGSQLHGAKDIEGARAPAEAVVVEEAEEEEREENLVTAAVPAVAPVPITRDTAAAPPPAPAPSEAAATEAVGGSAVETHVETRCCEHCQRNVPASNFDIHALHCARGMRQRRSVAEGRGTARVASTAVNDAMGDTGAAAALEKATRYCLRSCDVCGDKVPMATYQSHLADTCPLAEVSCPNDCGVVLPRERMAAEHDSICPNAPAQCEFCELVLPRHALDEHDSACGSRTETCDGCGERVMRKVAKAHSVACNRARGMMARFAVKEGCGGAGKSAAMADESECLDEPSAEQPLTPLQQAQPPKKASAAKGAARSPQLPPAQPSQPSQPSQQPPQPTQQLQPKQPTQPRQVQVPSKVLPQRRRASTKAKKRAAVKPKQPVVLPLSARLGEMEAMLRLAFSGAEDLVEAAQRVSKCQSFLTLLAEQASKRGLLQGTAFQQLMRGAQTGPSKGHIGRFRPDGTVNLPPPAAPCIFESELADVQAALRAQALVDLVRVKIEDDNDLKLARRCLDDSAAAIACLHERATAMGIADYECLERIRRGDDDDIDISAQPSSAAAVSTGDHEKQKEPKPPAQPAKATTKAPNAQKENIRKEKPGQKKQRRPQAQKQRSPTPLAESRTPQPARHLPRHMQQDLPCGPPAAPHAAQGTAGVPPAAPAAAQRPRHRGSRVVYPRTPPPMPKAKAKAPSAKPGPYAPRAQPPKPVAVPPRGPPSRRASVALGKAPAVGARPTRPAARRKSMPSAAHAAAAAAAVAKAPRPSSVAVARPKLRPQQKILAPLERQPKGAGNAPEKKKKASRPNTQVGKRPSGRDAAKRALMLANRALLG